MTHPAQAGDWYGLGTELISDGAVGHSGDIASYRSALRVWPEDDVSVAVLVPAPDAARAPGSPPLEALTEELQQVVAPPS